MDKPIDIAQTIEIIERMKFAKIGDYKKWETIIKKIKYSGNMDPLDLEYFLNLTRIYSDSNVSNRSKIYHTKLSHSDEKPKCAICGEPSLFYCNMNDQYFCLIHVVGHDENEI